MCVRLCVCVRYLISSHVVIVSNRWQNLIINTFVRSGGGCLDRNIRVYTAQVSYRLGKCIACVQKYFCNLVDNKN